MSSFHWLVIFLSAALTFFAWQQASLQLKERAAAKFDREADGVVELVIDRMKNYEDALRAGAAYHRLTPEMDVVKWKAYASQIQVEKRYPGINGIGVIYKVLPEELEDFVARQRLSRPEFRVYPAHDKSVYYPITYIEPLKGNEKAVGLDMAHEKNRYEAALKTISEKNSRITGPITLVQDEKKTPGFLFYTPLYNQKEEATGMVYAPFIMSRLMDGVLSKDGRHVSIEVKDKDTLLYSEFNEENADYTSQPILTRSVEVKLFGRSWLFKIQAAKSFGYLINSSQPSWILFVGISIDLMLVWLFTSISRANRRALSYAEELNSDLKTKTKELQAINEELEQFAYIASHDLKSPLRGIQTLANFLEEDCKTLLPPEGQEHLTKIKRRASKLSNLLSGLTEYAHLGKNHSVDYEDINVNELVQSVAELFEQETGVRVYAGENIELINYPRTGIERVLINLIDNAIKHHDRETANIKVSSIENEFGFYEFAVQDDGPGIPQEYHQKIFEIFSTLQPKNDTDAGGFGLSYVQKIVKLYGGSVRVESSGRGSTFKFTVPK